MQITVGSRIPKKLFQNKNKNEKAVLSNKPKAIVPEDGKERVSITKIVRI
jgi:hypothetical protein